jgi:4-hydroxybenzoate polyprenyltransferase
MRALAGAWLELSRVSNLPTVWTNVCAAWLIAGGEWADWRLAWLVLGGSLIYTAGMILNDAADARLDAVERPGRPIPSGRISLRHAWRAGFIMLLCGGGMMVGRGGADTAVVVALAAAVLLYDFYHKPWSGSVLVMAACRVLLYLAAASPLAEDAAKAWQGPALVPGLLLGAYITGLSLAARQESRSAGQIAATGVAGRVPALLLMAPVFSALAEAGMMARVCPVPIAAGLVWWLWRARRLARRDPPRSIGPAVGRLLAGIVWVDACLVAASHPKTAVLFVLLVPVAMLWQRRVAAT